MVALDSSTPRFAAITDKGLVRENNEDAFGAWPERGVFCVADGMGGAEGGEVASRIVVDCIARALGAADAPHADFDSTLEAVERAIAEADAEIRRHAAGHDARGCGSTVVAVCLDAADPGRAVALHVGDSRAYRLRGRRIVQLTADHSPAAALGVKDESRLPPALRSLLLRSVGGGDGLPPDRTPFEIAPGDRILLCSDGVSRQLPASRIAAAIRRCGPDADAAARELVRAANEAGGADNATALVVVPPAPGAARSSGRPRAARRILSVLQRIVRHGP